MCRRCVTVTANEPQITHITNKSFTFDYVYDTFAEQADVYNSAVDRLVEASLKGFNATVLAYGQVIHSNIIFKTGLNHIFCLDWVRKDIYTGDRF